MASNPFPFHNLPVLVQCKILRQYVPFLCKTFVLSHLPEFSELLDYRYSWLYLSETFINLSRILRSLDTGIYWNLEQDASTGYYVSVDAEKITFTLCGINEDSLYDFVYYVFYPFYRERMCISVQTWQNFLTIFLNKYSPTNRVCVYETNKGDYFYINYFNKKVYWSKKIYAIKDKKCIIKHSLEETFIIKLKDNDIIQFIHHKVQPPEICPNQPFKRTEQDLEPISLESYILDPQNKRVYNKRKILEMNFQIVEDHISLHTFCSSPRRRKLTSNSWRRWRNKFTELNNLFEPLKSCQCRLQKLERKSFS